MNQPILHTGKTFENVDYKGQKLREREFEDCTFRNCDFSDADLAGNAFTGCTFEGCNLTMVKLSNARLHAVRFLSCKLTGVEFGVCSLFSFSIECRNCNMSYVSFQGLKMEKTAFRDCNLTEAIFADCNLKSTLFSGCNLAGTLFEHNAMEMSDLRTSVNLTIDPEINKLRKARVNFTQLSGLLSKYGLDIESV